MHIKGFPGGSVVKIPPADAGEAGDMGSTPGWAWQPTPLFTPRKSHGQRSLEGYNPRGSKRVGHDLAMK